MWVTVTCLLSTYRDNAAFEERDDSGESVGREDRRASARVQRMML